MERNTLVVLSGGQDSTTCLYWAKQRLANGGKLHAITFDYGQRHDIEIEAAMTIADMAEVDAHHIARLGYTLLGTSPLVNADYEVEEYDGPDALPGGIEKTFVPGRNALFLVLAANYAMAHGLNHIVTGVAEEDYGGYPDCRQEFITSMQESLGLAMTGDENHFVIHTPLMRKSKKETVLLAADLPGCMDALAYSHTCYHGLYPPNPNNHASCLRAKGFAEANIPDPLILRAKEEGLLDDSEVDDFGLVTEE